MPTRGPRRRSTHAECMLRTRIVLYPMFSSIDGRAYALRISVQYLIHLLQFILIPVPPNRPAVLTIKVALFKGQGGAPQRKTVSPVPVLSLSLNDASE